MANHMQTVRQGRSLPFTFDRGGESLDGWVCTINVKRFPGDSADISRVIAADGLDWPGFLTATETAALGTLGTWMLLGVITNATEDRAEYPIIRFSLAEAM